MFVHIAFIVFALLLLFAGAEGLVRGSSSLALRAGLSRLMIGLTVVALGTSSPELVVSIKAALSQQGNISVGNVVGSNSFNVGVILGVTALVCSIPVHQQIIRLDAPVALGLAFAVPLLVWNDVVGRVEGCLLVAAGVAYTWMNVALARKQTVVGAEGSEALPVPGVSRHWGIDLAFALGGLAVLVLGSRLLVDHAVDLAQAFGVSEAVIGLTIVAAGTSMPELATSLVAALRGQPDLAIGNIVGSNVFNILVVLGVASVVSPLEASGLSGLDLTMMIVFSALLIPLLYTGRLLHRLEGAALLALYGVYLFLLWPR